MKNQNWFSKNPLLIIGIIVVVAIVLFFVLRGTNTNESNTSQISWVPIVPPSKETGKIVTSSSADCLPGSQCQDVVVFNQTAVENYYSCNLDEQCAFFSGFTGVQSGNELPKTNVQAQTRGSASDPTQYPGGGAITTDPALPTAVSGAEGCFNKQELLQNARNKNDIREDSSIKCECGIEPPSYSIRGSSGAVDANSGEVTPGTTSRVENQAGEAWSCMKPEIRPDIMTENFIFPQSVNVNSPFSISFDYKNVGAVGCLEIYFQTDITRTIAGQSEYLDGVGAHILYDTPINPGEGDTFTFGSQLLPPFSLAGDYTLNLAMLCESPRETHIVNGFKEINIQVN